MRKERSFDLFWWLIITTMGFDLITTFLFALILFVLYYAYDSKTRVIDERKPENAEPFTGDYEDYILADIHTNPAYTDPLAPDDCDEMVEDMSRRQIGDRRVWKGGSDSLLAATGRRDASWNVVYDDYSVTESEVDMLTGVSLVKSGMGRYTPRSSSRSLEEHDYKGLE
jgi:hypothetical protein